MPKIVLTPEEERLNLEKAVALANDYSGHETMWQGKRYGPDEATQFRRMLHALQTWLESGSRHIGDIKLDRSDRAELEKHMTQIHPYVLQDGTLMLRDHPSPWNEAIYQFTQLLNNSQRDLLGGPCRNRKKHEDRDHWYVKKTHRLSVFCSRVCAGDATKAKERQRNYNKKIEKAERAIRNYAGRPPRFSKLSWQEYVIEDSRPGPRKKPSISKKFLTMAVKNGRLTPPKGVTDASLRV